MSIRYLISRHSNMHTWQHLMLPCMTALCLMASCSSNEVIEKIEEIKTSNDPLTFTCNIQDNPSASATRAQSLDTDFMVSAYKSYNTAKEQVVMDKYIVKHSTSGSDWDGNTSHNWDYVGVDGQIERYWDYDNFPYRFNAIAPCPSDKSSHVLTDKNLTINATYKMQTCTDGVVSPSLADAEPYLVSQVQRGTDGKDMDVFSETEINSGSTTLNRYVALPFHHLNSKIRFGVYSLNHWATEHKLYIKDLVITATSDNKFVTEAAKYTSAGTSSWKIETGTSGFAGLTTATDANTSTTLFSFSGFKDGVLLEDNDLRKHQGQSSAYFMQCKDGIIQIPQVGVEMKVSLDLMQEDGSLLKKYTNIPVVLRLEDNTIQENYNWVSGNIYTYYLILDFDKNLEIQFTATLTPWEDISGSLSTDLEQ